MRKLYNISNKANIIQSETGEIKAIEVENTISQVSMFPVNSKDRTMIYMNDFTRIIELNKTEQLMFFAILQNCDGYNIVKSSWKDIAKDITSDQSRISKTIKQLKDLNFIAKIEGKYMVNPFIVLPRYDRNERESQWLCQQVWKLYTEDMNTYIPDDYISTVKYMLGLKESTHIKVGNKKSEEQSKFVEKPNNKNSYPFKKSQRQTRKFFTVAQRKWKFSRAVGGDFLHNPTS